MKVPELNEPLTLLTDKLKQLEHRKYLVMHDKHVKWSYTEEELKEMRDDLDSRIPKFKAAIHWLSLLGKDRNED